MSPTLLGFPPVTSEDCAKLKVSLQQSPWTLVPHPQTQENGGCGAGKHEREGKEWRKNRGLTWGRGRGRLSGPGTGRGARRQGRLASAAGQSSFHIVLLSAPTTSSAMLKGHWLCSATSAGCLLSIKISSPIWAPISYPGGHGEASL